jgi:hypothetical protein
MFAKFPRIAFVFFVGLATTVGGCTESVGGRSPHAPDSSGGGGYSGSRVIETSAMLTRVNAGALRSDSRSSVVRSPSNRAHTDGCGR